MSGAGRSVLSWPCVLSLITQAEVHHGKQAPVNVLRGLYSSETGSCFQPVCGHNRFLDALRDDGWSILTMNARTTSREQT